MNFNSLLFLIYLPIVLLVYWLLPQKAKWAFLLVASYFFYAFQNYWLILLILSTTLVSYLCSLGISKTEKTWAKRFLLGVALTFMLGMLFVFKYLDFAVSSVVSLSRLFGAKTEFHPFRLILPVGISFYTFQTLSYVIDVYKGKYPAEKHFGYYALFVSFFPQLVAGPIERPQDLIPQLKAERHLSSDDFSIGLQYVVCGFVKKIVIADFLGTYVAPTYGTYMQASGFALLLATVFFAIQIYGDFSGYSDIAIGVARWMGIKLTKNFDHPYLATSVRDFYRRWHITLNIWLTDYVYIPLGGSHKGKARHLLNVLIVFLVSGLWHGANWNFVVWGLLNGLIICAEILLSRRFETWKNATPKRSKAVSVISVPITFLLVCATWIFFRSPDVMTAFRIYGRVFTSFVSGSGLEAFRRADFLLRVFAALGLFVLLPYLPRLSLETDENGNVDGKRLTVTSFVYVVLILLIGFAWMEQLKTTGESGFIYFQF